MASSTYPLRNSGIYRNLPTFDPSLKGLTALICGGSGISGFHALRAILETPERWSKIYVLSRSGLPKSMEALLTQEQQERIQYVSIDLQTSGAEIAAKLKQAQVQPDYIFFYSYMSPKSTNAMNPDAAKEIYELNVPLLGNLLDALPQANVKPKRVLLQTGGKHYGMHIGRGRNPIMESDPAPKHLQPDQFYYEQERQLFDYCSKHPETDWNIVRPGGIVGAINSTWLNSFYPFGVYAAVQDHKGEPLEFGGDFESWQYPLVFSTARMTGYLAEWAILNDATANQDFNAADGSLFCWERFFHEMANWYHVKKGVTLPKSDEERNLDQAITLAGGKDAPLGYGPPIKAAFEFRLSDWAKKTENREAWKQIMAKNGEIDFDPFASQSDIANTFNGDYCYLRLGLLSQEKARNYGFNGYVNTVEAIHEMFEECARMGMLPPMKVEGAK